eukprot:Ihof_evm6s258 gene=Ihof_evmTU6s258
MSGSELFGLIGLSLAMLGGSFLAGSLPLTMNLSEKNIQLCNILGAGLLVGTALAVIIPEGMQTLYSMPPPGHGDVHAGEQRGHDHPAQCGAAMHGYIGLVLVAGFLFQLLVDKLAFGHSHNHSPGGGGENLPMTGNGFRINKLSSATLGLVIHSAADGIALGAASSSTKSELEFLVFVAIMIHKAPAAFGLASFLLAEGLDKKRVRQHLLAFSLAAPVLAIVTFIIIKTQDVPGTSTSDSPITGL